MRVGESLPEKHIFPSLLTNFLQSFQFCKSGLFDHFGTPVLSWRVYVLEKPKPDNLGLCDPYQSLHLLL
jgi:hypothetical protein